MAFETQTLLVIDKQDVLVCLGHLEHWCQLGMLPKTRISEWLLLICFFLLSFSHFRIQNLDSIVRTADRELPVVNTRGDVLFNSWNGIFNGQGGFFSQAPRIYSFSGKNVNNDPLW
jgi:hypothetical protein